MSKFKFSRFIVLGLILSVPSASFSSGVDLLLLYGTRYVGMGGNHVSLTGDAYSIFYNPATMSGVKDKAFAVNSTNILLRYEAPIGADNAQKDGDIVYAPLFFIGQVFRLHERVTAGIGVFPTALQGGLFTGVDYNVALPDRRYRTQLVRVELSPAIAVELNKHLSIGAAYKMAYNRYEKTVGVFAPPTTGLEIDQEAQTWSFDGFKLGAFLNNFHQFSAGVTYRFKNPLKLDGHANLDGGAGPTKYNVTQKIDVPAQLQAGVSYEWIPDRITSAFTFEYTWNDVLKYDWPISPSLPETTLRTPLGYKNAVSLHLGSEYATAPINSRRWRYGAGLAYDQASRRAEIPNPALPPAADYWGISGSVQREVGSHIFGTALNYGAYEHTSTTIDPALTAKAFKGKYALWIFVASFDYQYKF